VRAAARAARHPGPTSRCVGRTARPLLRARNPRARCRRRQHEHFAWRAVPACAGVRDGVHHEPAAGAASAPGAPAVLRTTRQQRPGRHGGPQVREPGTLEEASTRRSARWRCGDQERCERQRHEPTRTRAAGDRRTRVVRARQRSATCDDVQDGQGRSRGPQQPGDGQHRQRERPPPADRASERRAATATSTMPRRPGERQPRHGFRQVTRIQRSLSPLQLRRDRADAA